jgi:hypothetical protein
VEEEDGWSTGVFPVPSGAPDPAVWAWTEIPNTTKEAQASRHTIGLNIRHLLQIA